MPHPLPEEADHPTHLRVVAGDRTFLLPIAQVAEVVVPPTRVAPIPRARPPIRGAVNLRGQVVALVDLAGILGLGASGGRAEVARAVLLEGAALAVLVDEVRGFAAGTAPSDDECLTAADLVGRVERLLHPPREALGYLSPRTHDAPPEPEPP